MAYNTLSESMGRLLDFFHTQLDNGASLKDLPLAEFRRQGPLSEYQLANFLIKRCEKGESEAVVANFGNHNFLGYENEIVRVLTAAVENGFPAGKLPIHESMHEFEKGDHKVLWDAIIKSGKAEDFLQSLRTSEEFVVLHHNIIPAHDYIVKGVNAQRTDNKLLEFHQVFAEEIRKEVLEDAKKIGDKRKRLDTFTDALNKHGLDALKLMDAYDRADKKRYVAYDDVSVSPRLKNALFDVFNTACQNGLEDILKCVNIIPLLREVTSDGKITCLRISPRVLDAVATHPALLKAIEAAASPEKRLGYADDYFQLSKAAVTNPDFNWKDLNLVRLSGRLWSNSPKLELDEQLDAIVASAKKAGARVPKEFEQFYTAGLNAAETENLLALITPMPCRTNTAEESKPKKGLLDGIAKRFERKR